MLRTFIATLLAGLFAFVLPVTAQIAPAAGVGPDITISGNITANSAAFSDTVRTVQIAGTSGTNYIIPDASNLYPSQADNIFLGKSSNPWYAIYVGSGGLFFSKTVTSAGTTGSQTINKTSGSVNFAASASSLVVTNSLCASSSVIICTVGSNDSTMKSASVVAGNGSFTIYANAVPTAETRVNFLISN